MIKGLFVKLGKFLKFFKLKYVIPVLLTVAVVAGVIWLIGHLGEGPGTGKSSGDLTKPVTTVSPTVTESAFNGTIVHVTVMGNEYFYDNQRITLTELLDELETIQERLVVEIIDDNASLNAYDGLIEALEDAAYDYTEKYADEQ